MATTVRVSHQVVFKLKTHLPGAAWCRFEMTLAKENVSREQGSVVLAGLEMLKLSG